MKRLLISTLVVFSLLLTLGLPEAQVIPPKAHGTGSGGATIEEKQAEDAMGPKARGSWRLCLFCLFPSVIINS